MNGYGAEAPMVSGAEWQRARNLLSRTRPAASHAQQYFPTAHVPPQIYAIFITVLRYVNTF